MKREKLVLGICIGIIIISGCIQDRITGLDRGTYDNLEKDNLDMANTIDPIITNICINTCNGSRSILVHKKEKYDNNWKFCNSGVSNVYYCRCYETIKVKKTNGTCEYHSITKDVPILDYWGYKIYSCINETNLLIPYYNKKIAKSNIGDKILIACYNTHIKV